MRCDAVIVGGGIVGLSAALHLKEQGLERVAVLERKVLASGGSGLGTGSVHTQRWFATDSDLILRSRKIIDRLAVSSNGIFRLYPVGRLTVVGAEDGDKVRTYGKHLNSIGIEAEALDQMTLKEKFPDMNVSDVGQALYTPKDGVVYPPALVWALNGLYRMQGGILWEGCGVVRIRHQSGSVTGVELQNGDVIETGRVIVTSGVWTRKILKESGLGLAMKHAVTHNTVVSVGRTDLWGQVPSLLDGCQGVIAIPRNPGQIMAANTFGEFEAASDLAERVLATTTVDLGAEVDRMRAATTQQQTEVLGQLRHRYEGYDIRGVCGHWAGILDGTPDNHPFIGGYPGVAGLWVGCGLTGYGVQRGPGVGEALAALALDQPLEVDIGEYRLDRFEPELDFRLDLSSDNPFEGFAALAKERSVPTEQPAS